MVLYFLDFYRIMVKISLVVVGLNFGKDVLFFLKDNVFCYIVIIYLFDLFLLERKIFNLEIFYVMVGFYKVVYNLRFEFFLEYFLLEYIDVFLKDIVLLRWLNVNDLKEFFLVFINMVIVIKGFFNVFDDVW